MFRVRTSQPAQAGASPRRFVSKTFGKLEKNKQEQIVTLKLATDKHAASTLSTQNGDPLDHCKTSGRASGRACGRADRRAGERAKARARERSGARRGANASQAESRRSRETKEPQPSFWQSPIDEFSLSPTHTLDDGDVKLGGSLLKRAAKLRTQVVCGLLR